MSVAGHTFRIGADELYEAIVDAEQYPHWLVGAKVVRVDDPSWPAKGASFEHKVGAGPIEVADHTTVTDVQPGRVLQLIVRARPFLEADVRFTISESCGKSVTSTLRMDERPRGVFRLAGPFIGPLVKVRNERSLQRLDDLLQRRSRPATAHR